MLVFLLARPVLRWPSENARSALRFMDLEARLGAPSAGTSLAMVPRCKRWQKGIDEHGAAKSVVVTGIAACSSSSSIICIG
ncbi:hypothetical protein ACSRUE_12870 [Sorangium sp. KYC3313]|uniref:hypothetical protein n=1 Tax=Sorangium sp. KYC3313 TaxID=3449740 RepID=UPI003F8A9F35